MRIELIAIISGKKITPKTNFEEYVSAKKTHCNFVSCSFLQYSLLSCIRLASAHLLRYLLSQTTDGYVCTLRQTTLHSSFRIFENQICYQNDTGAAGATAGAFILHIDIGTSRIISFFLFTLRSIERNNLRCVLAPQFGLKMVFLKC